MREIEMKIYKITPELIQRFEKEGYRWYTGCRAIKIKPIQVYLYINEHGRLVPCDKKEEETK